jgi:hypothetical protein
MLKLCPLMAAILNGGRGGVTGHNFESWPPKDHSCHVCFKLTYLFQRRRLLKHFSIGTYVKIKSSHGGHLEFPISKRFTSLVQDHPMIIPAKSHIGPYGNFTFSSFFLKPQNRFETKLGRNVHWMVIYLIFIPPLVEKGLYCKHLVRPFTLPLKMSQLLLEEMILFLIHDFGILTCRHS